MIRTLTSAMMVAALFGFASFQAFAEEPAQSPMTPPIVAPAPPPVATEVLGLWLFQKQECPGSETQTPVINSQTQQLLEEMIQITADGKFQHATKMFVKYTAQAEQFARGALVQLQNLAANGSTEAKKEAGLTKFLALLKVYDQLSIGTECAVIEKGDVSTQGSKIVLAGKTLMTSCPIKPLPSSVEMGYEIVTSETGKQLVLKKENDAQICKLPTSSSSTWYSHL